MAHPPPYPGAPGWAKLFGIVTVVALLLVVILIFSGGPGGRGHGPGLHTPSGDDGEHTPPGDGH